MVKIFISFVLLLSNAAFADLYTNLQTGLNADEKAIVGNSAIFKSISYAMGEQVLYVFGIKGFEINQANAICSAEGYTSGEVLVTDFFYGGTNDMIIEFNSDAEVRLFKTFDELIAIRKLSTASGVPIVKDIICHDPTPEFPSIAPMGQ